MTALAAFATGYALGRRAGGRRGYALGMAEAPLRMRARALLDGQCLLCGSAAWPETAEAAPESQQGQNNGALVRDNQPEVVMCPSQSAEPGKPNSAMTG